MISYFSDDDVPSDTFMSVIAFGGQQLVGEKSCDLALDGSTVKTIQFWASDGYVTGVFWELTSGVQKQMGYFPDGSIMQPKKQPYLSNVQSGPALEINLEDDEQMQVIKTTCSEDKLGVGMVTIRTNKNRTFSTPDLGITDPTFSYFSVPGSGFCAGLFGYYGVQKNEGILTNLGFAMLLPIASARLVIDSYTLPDLDKLKSQPLYAPSQKYDNTDDSQEQGEDISYTRTLSAETTWSVESTTYLGLEISISAGIPFIEKYEAGGSFDVSRASYHSQKASVEFKIEFDWPLSVPSGKALIASSKVWCTQLTCPYQGKLYLELVNGKQLQSKYSGTYKGVCFTMQESIFENSNPTIT